MAAVQYHHGKFPPEELNYETLLPLIGPAHTAIGTYSGLLNAIPNTRVLLSPLSTQEAVLSSKIEGTQTTMSEVLEFEAVEEAASESRRDDFQEVLNYRRAMIHAVQLMNDIPLSQRLLRGAHEVLMQGARGQNKAPGQYRKQPNWIGLQGQPVELARFVPPDAQQIPELMSSWERYLHSQTPDALIQLAVLHAEFESIHPFYDGNGRLGRLLVPLLLVDKKILNSPDFYISAYLEAHCDEYYDRLLAVSRDDDWTGWCAFFLKALHAQAKDNCSKAKSILTLYEMKKHEIMEQTRSKYALLATDWFFNYPVFKSSAFIHKAGIPESTATRILREVRDHGLLQEVHPAGGRKSAVLVFSDLLNIAEGRHSP